MSLKFLSRGAWRLTLDVEMILPSPLHVGTGQSLTLQTDSPILRDHNQNPVLPGSSIRGVLRHWAEREIKVLGVSEKVLYQLFGPNIQSMNTLDHQGRLTVTTAGITKSQNNSEIRDHIRLNEKYGTVDTGAKFDQEVALIKQITFSLIYEGDGPDDPELLILNALKNALEANLFSFGGKSSIGLGAAKRVCVKSNVCDRSSPEGFKAYLKERSEPYTTKTTPFDWAQVKPIKSTVKLNEENIDKARNTLLPLNWMTLDIKLQCDGPTLTAGPYQGDDNMFYKIRAIADSAWLTRPDGTAYLSGSALRGVLRSHARHILKSLQPDKSDMTLADHLFGQVKGNEGQKGMLSVGEGKITETHGIFMNHVAIDRVSGFASDSALFNAAALASPEFSLRLKFFWEPEDKSKSAAIALLFFVLRDLEEGLLWIGSNTTAGYGHVKSCIVEQAVWSLIHKAEGPYYREDKSPFKPDSISALAKDEALNPLFSSWRELMAEHMEVSV